jgi:hypothetical protein
LPDHGQQILNAPTPNPYRKLFPDGARGRNCLRRSPNTIETHDGIDLAQRSTRQDKWRNRSRQIHAARQSTGPPPFRHQLVIDRTAASMREPTVSIPSAQRAFTNGFAGPAGFSQFDDGARAPVF